MSEPENRNEDANVLPEVEPTSSTEQSTSEVEVASTEVATDIVSEAESVSEAPAVVAPAAEETVVSDTATTETTTEAVAPAVAAGGMATLAAKFMPRKWQYTVLTVVVIIVVLLGLTYLMEQQGRIQTGLFDGVNKMISMKKSVAVVNDAKITEYDLNISISQIASGAKLQGIDTEDPEVKKEITAQALDMLVNTELLKQEAATRDIVITDADVDARLETLRTDVGGPEVLVERMKEFNIDEKTLRRDIRNELTIQKLLDEVFEEKGITITEAEIKELYDAAGGTAAGLPPLAEVREQIETQIRTTKEQEIVTGFVEELKGEATVEVLI